MKAKCRQAATAGASTRGRGGTRPLERHPLIGTPHRRLSVASRFATGRVATQPVPSRRTAPCQAWQVRWSRGRRGTCRHQPEPTAAEFKSPLGHHLPSTRQARNGRRPRVLGVPPSGGRPPRLSASRLPLAHNALPTVGQRERCSPQRPSDEGSRSQWQPSWGWAPCGDLGHRMHTIDAHIVPWFTGPNGGASGGSMC